MDTALLVIAVLCAMISVAVALHINMPFIKAQRRMKHEMKIIKKAVLRYTEATGGIFPYAHHARVRGDVTFSDMLPRDLLARVFWNQPMTEPKVYYIITHWPLPNRFGCGIRGCHFVDIRHDGRMSRRVERREIKIKR